MRLYSLRGSGLHVADKSIHPIRLYPSEVLTVLADPGSYRSFLGRPGEPSSRVGELPG